MISNFARLAVVLLVLAIISATVGTVLIASAYLVLQAAVGCGLAVLGLCLFVAARWVGEES